MRTTRIGLATLFAAAICWPAGAATYDTPLKTQVIKLPPEPEDPQSKPTRTCTFYTAFLVKEIDLGEVGAAEDSITPVHGAAPPCTTKIAGETIIPPDAWSGYFKGAKGDFLFIDGSDGWNGGMPFAVFSATTAKKLFEEARKGDTFAAIDLKDGALAIRYRRVWQAPCSLMTEPEACWKQIVAAASLQNARRPDCSAAYKKEMERTPKFAKDIPPMHTVISYEAEARYTAGKLVITPRSGAVECWLPD
jgi:hypothetical protein